MALSLICNLLLPSSVPSAFAPSSSSSTTSSYLSSSISSCFTLSVGTPVSETSVPFGSASPPSTSICCWTKRLIGAIYDPRLYSPSLLIVGLWPFSGALKLSSSLFIKANLWALPIGTESLKSSRGKLISASSLSPYPSITAFDIIYCLSNYYICFFNPEKSGYESLSCPSMAFLNAG